MHLKSMTQVSSATTTGSNMSDLLLLMLLLWLSATTSSAPTGRVPAIIVFGDSTVDSGNNNVINTMLKSNFPPYGRDFMGGKPTGRFSNGRLGTDFYAEAFGLGPIVPAYFDPAYGIEDFATAVCFASAGTGLDQVTSDVLSVIPLWKEVAYFKEYQAKLRAHLGEAKANKRLNDALYVISIGTNDFIENYYLPFSSRAQEYTIDLYVDFLVGLAREFVTQIYQLGARKIAYTGLSPMGCVPIQRTTNFFNGGGCVEEQNQVAANLNSKLQVMIEEMNSALPNMQMKYLNVYYPIQYILNNPSIYGFENVDVGCCATGMFELSYLCDQWNPFTCIDASKYVFWDAVHPSEKMAYIIASYIINSTLVDYM